MKRLLFSIFRLFGVFWFQGRVSHTPRQRIETSRAIPLGKIPCLFLLEDLGFRLSLANQRVESNYYLTFRLNTFTIEKEKPDFPTFRIRQEGRRLRNGRWLHYSLLLFASAFTQSNRQKSTTETFRPVTGKAGASRPRILRGASPSQRNGPNPVLSIGGIRI